MKYHVFVSYADADLPWARQIHDELTARGFKVWFAEKDAPHGENFARAIEEGLQASHATLFLVTHGAAQKLSPMCARSDNWLRTEYDIAFGFKNEREPPMRIVALRVGNADLPPALSRLTWVDCPGLPVGTDQLESMLKAIQMPVEQRDTPSASEVRHQAPDTLARTIGEATRSLVIVGHTLDKFTQSAEVRGELARLVRQRVEVTLVLLNPYCDYARAHEPFHEQESRTTAEEEISGSINRLTELFEQCGCPRNFRVYATNYMPRFRTILIDGRKAFLHLYLYGHDVPATHDIRADKAAAAAHESRLYAAIERSVEQLLNSPDVVPILRDGVHLKRWADREEATSFRWSPERRRRFLTTQAFYLTQAAKFRDRTYDVIELYVRRFLAECAAAAVALGRPVLVLGCGPGKEVRFLEEKGCRAQGMDFSAAMIRMAREDHPALADRFIEDDFYNLAALQAGQFGAIVANAALVHLHVRDDLAPILRQIHRMLCEGGLAFIRMLEKDGVQEEYDNVLFGSQRWFVYFTVDELTALAQATGFEVVSVDRHEHHHYEHVFWPCLLLRKPVPAATAP